MIMGLKSHKLRRNALVESFNVIEVIVMILLMRRVVTISMTLNRTFPNASKQMIFGIII
jgi:hypothetical protein